MELLIPELLITQCCVAKLSGHVMSNQPPEESFLFMFFVVEFGVV